MEQSKPEEVVTPTPEAAPAAPVTPAAKPGPSKKTWMIVAVVAVVAVVVIAAIVLGTGMLNGDDDDTDDGGDGNGGGDVLTWEPESGDFIEYTTTTFIGEMVVKQTYKEVTTTTVTINTTSTVMGMTSYDEQTIPIEQNYGGAEFDVSDPPEGYNVVDKGSQSISTEWGSKSCKHYEVTTSEGGMTSTMDMWIYKGILMKMVMAVGDMDMTMTLTDTNVNEITG